MICLCCRPKLVRSGSVLFQARWSILLVANQASLWNYQLFHRQSSTFQDVVIGTSWVMTEWRACCGRNMLVKSLEQISLCHCCIYILAFITAVPTNHNSFVQDVENRVYLNSCCQFQRSFVKFGKRTRRILLQKGCQRGPQQKDCTKIYQVCSAGGTRSASMLCTPRVLSLSEVHRLKRLEPHTWNVPTLPPQGCRSVRSCCAHRRSHWDYGSWSVARRHCPNSWNHVTSKIFWQASKYCIYTYHRISQSLNLNKMLSWASPSWGHLRTSSKHCAVSGRLCPRAPLNSLIFL